MEIQIITVCQGIADSLDEGIRTDAIIIDYLKAIDLVLHDRKLKKSRQPDWMRIVAWVKEFLLGRS